MEVREVIVALSSGNGINSKLKIMEVGIEPEQKLESSWLISGQSDITTESAQSSGMGSTGRQACKTVAHIN